MLILYEGECVTIFFELLSPDGPYVTTFDEVTLVVSYISLAKMNVHAAFQGCSYSL